MATIFLAVLLIFALVQKGSRLAHGGAYLCHGSGGVEEHSAADPLSIGGAHAHATTHTHHHVSLTNPRDCHYNSTTGGHSSFSATALGGE